MTSERLVIAMAHRGFSAQEGHRFENSMRAFDEAVRLGYGWVETDVHATSDGVLLAFHDATLDRTTTLTGAIAELPWSQVQHARIGGVEPIARLEELLQRHPHLEVNIDIKAEAAVAPLVECIERLGAHERVRVTSFSDRRRRDALAGLSKPVRSSPGQALMAAAWGAAHLPGFGQPLFARLTRHVDALQIPERLGRLRVLDTRLLAAAHRAGLGVHVWTVNDPLDMERLLEAGVDGIITDRADLLRDLLVERGQWVEAPRA